MCDQQNEKSPLCRDCAFFEPLNDGSNNGTCSQDGKQKDGSRDWCF